MKAMVLAAGKGERMLSLTKNKPKPMLEVGGKPLIEHMIEKLVSSGIRDIVINHARFGDSIENFLGDGERYGATINYSSEGEEPLETGGGIYHALPLLGDEPFLTVNADIWTDYPFKKLTELKPEHAHLVLTNNPPHHPDGDFALAGQRLGTTETPRYTFTGIAVYHPDFFKWCKKGKFALAPLLRNAINRGEVTGELYPGEWIDIGTPERLEIIRKKLGSKR